MIEAMKDSLAKRLGAVPEGLDELMDELIEVCPPGSDWIEFVELGDTASGSRPKKKKKKRKPSAYNMFMGECVKDGGDFKSCATKWKGMAQTEKDRYKPS